MCLKALSFTRHFAEMLGSPILNPTRKQGKQSGLRIRTESIPSTRTADGWREEKFCSYLRKK